MLDQVCMVWKEFLDGVVFDDYCYLLWLQGVQVDDVVFMIEGWCLVCYDVYNDCIVVLGGGKVGMLLGELQMFYLDCGDVILYKYDEQGYNLCVCLVIEGGVLINFEIDCNGIVIDWWVGLLLQVDYVEGCLQVCCGFRIGLCLLLGDLLMIVVVIWFVLGLVLFVLGGDLIVKVVFGLVQCFGVLLFVVGLLLVVFGILLFELVVNVCVFVVGVEVLVLGNVVGSNIVNVGLILGMVVFVVLLLVCVWLFLLLLVLLVVFSLVLIVFGLDGVIVCWEGVVLLLGFVVVLVFVLCCVLYEFEFVCEVIVGYVMICIGLFFNVLCVVFVVVCLYYGVCWIVQVVLVFGVGLGWLLLLVGLLLVVIGIVLLEVVVVIVVVCCGQGDMVLGYVIGLSLFNLLVVVGGMVVL